MRSDTGEMKDMFYKYDHKADENAYAMPLCAEQGDELAQAGSARPLFNAKGEKIGIKAAKNSNFSLYFNMFGSVGGEYNLHEFLTRATFELSILDFKREVVYKTYAFADEHEDFVKIDLEASEDGELHSGVYRLQLDLIMDDEYISVFSDNNMILSIE